MLEKYDIDLKAIELDEKVFNYSLDDDFFTQPDYVDVLVDLAKTSKPFLDFLNYTVDDFIRNN